MKNLILLFVAACATITLNACKKDTAHFRVSISVLSSFNQDKVQVFLDGKEKLNKQLQTNYSLGAAIPDGNVNMLLKKSNHTLKVIVNDSTIHEETFSLKGDLYIGINYERPGHTISFVYSDHPFAYD